MEEKDKFEINHLFFDKRDSSYLKITSNHYYFEAFSKKKYKCDQMIPETIVFYSGQIFFHLFFNHQIKKIGVPKIWLFNSSKTKGNIILKKNNDKMNPVGIIQGLSRIRIDREKADNIIILKEIVRNLPLKAKKYFF